MPKRLVRDWTDSEVVNSLSPEAEVFFTRLIMKADDYGRYHANVKLLKSLLFPLRSHLLEEAQVIKWIQECQSAGLISIYMANGKSYLVIIRFGQRKRSPSKIPPPPKEILDYIEECEKAALSYGDSTEDSGLMQSPPSNSSIFRRQMAAGCSEVPQDSGVNQSRISATPKPFTSESHDNKRVVKNNPQKTDTLAAECGQMTADCGHLSDLGGAGAGAGGGAGAGAGKNSFFPPVGVGGEVPTLEMCQEYAKHPCCGFPPDLVAEWYDVQLDRGWGFDWMARMRSSRTRWQKIWRDRKEAGEAPKELPPVEGEKEWYDCAFSAFPIEPPAECNSDVLNNIRALIASGKTFEEFQRICAWQRAEKSHFKSDTPAGLTALSKWDKWLGKANKGPSKSLTRSPSLIKADIKVVMEEISSLQNLASVGMETEETKKKLTRMRNKRKMLEDELAQ